MNEQGIYNRCAVPELAVTHNQKIWQEERKKFTKFTEIYNEGEDFTEDIINSKETAKKRKQKWGEEGETAEEYSTKKKFLHKPDEPLLKN